MKHRSESGFVFVAVLFSYALLSAAHFAARGRLRSEPFLTVPVQLLLCGVLLVRLRRRGLLSYYGLTPVRALAHKKLLYYLPLVLLCCPNLLSGAAGKGSGTDLLLLLGMLLTGFMEELFFRSFLVRLLQRKSEQLAIMASAFLFGAAHLLNLSSGQSAAYTLWQAGAAAAFGFMAAVFLLKTGSILPCVLCHGVMNMEAALLPSAPPAAAATALAVMLLAAGYGCYLLRMPTVGRENASGQE